MCCWIISPNLIKFARSIGKAEILLSSNFKSLLSSSLPTASSFVPFYISSNNFCEKKSDLTKIDFANFTLDSIRNFSIIAHIDHGKSTLADRILEYTGAIKAENNQEQILDTLQVEKERGITVKARSASVLFHHKNKDYLLNLIDTPGHVDFSYEVSRSLAACQGVVLLVDANQGVQAQTVANFYLAFTSELSIVTVLNKIDLKTARSELVIEQLFNILNIYPDDVLKVSAKYGTGVEDLLGSIVEKIPSPAQFCSVNSPTRALLFDSWYDKYKGVICQVLIVDGTLKKGDIIQSCSTKKSYEIKNISYLSPTEVPIEQLYAGQVGVIIANMKKTDEAKVGDTFHLVGDAVEPLPGFKESKPMVFAGIYAMESKDQTFLQNAIERLSLNDASVSISLETSEALGQGWRVGFLGLLHMDVFTTRLEQEFGISVVVTTPSVPYMIKKVKDSSIVKRKKFKQKKEDNISDEFIVNNPALWPEFSTNVETFEPMVRGTIIVPETFVAVVSRLCDDRRGEPINLQDLGSDRVIMSYKFPLNEIVVDFFDILKSVTSGYATFDYEASGYEPSNLVKVGIKLNGKLVEEFSCIVHQSRAQEKGRQLCLKLVETLPRQMFQIAIQAVIGSKIIARENVKALRKDVLAKCYGGDVSRKMKLLKRQAEGKKRLKMISNIEIPRETFMSILKK